MSDFGPPQRQIPESNPKCLPVRLQAPATQPRDIGHDCNTQRGADVHLGVDSVIAPSITGRFTIENPPAPTIGDRTLTTAGPLHGDQVTGTPALGCWPLYEFEARRTAEDSAA